MTEQPFRFAPSFYKVEDSGTFVPGDFEAQYEALFAQALSHGGISAEERRKLDVAASALGIDAHRLAMLESALRDAYESRAAISSAEDTAPPDTLVERSAKSPRAASVPEISAAWPEFTEAPTTRTAPPAFDPHDELRARFSRGTLDEQFRIASVLVLRGAANDRERALYTKCRTASPLRPTHALTASSWADLRHPSQDALTGDIFSMIASAALIGRLSAMRRDKALPKLDPTKKQDPATSTVSATRALSWAAATLGMSAPPIYLAPESSDGMVVMTSLPPAVRLGANVLRGQSSLQLAFHSARALSWLRAEHFVCTLVAHVSHLEDMFLAALRIGVPELPMPKDVIARVDVVKAAIVPVLEANHVANLKQRVLAFAKSGGKTNLRAWAQGAELTACRAGLLLAGDLETCAGIVSKEPSGVARVRDLEEFWLSDACTRLRKHLGVAL